MTDMRRRRTRWFSLLALFAALLFGRGADAGEVAVAVAANFLEPLKAMVEPFAKATGARLEPRPGSTGELYAQIENGAPYDVFLSADAERAEKLEKSGLGVAGTRFTYAIGKLVLWSTDEKRIPADGAAALRDPGFVHLAIADPKTAPYGAAAIQTLERLGVRAALEPKLVYGQSVSQVFQFVTTGNAELGFLALSQIEGPGKKPVGSRWLVPAELHDPIRQDAVLLRRASESAPSRAFLDFLHGVAGLAIIRSFGYDVPGVKR
jgi:molybdate transport system substrate-binding protein